MKIWPWLFACICLLAGWMAAIDLTEQRQEFKEELQVHRVQVLEHEERIRSLEVENEELLKQNKALLERLEGVVYPLTAEERALVEGVVTAEAEGQGFEGQVLVAQCIRNAAEIDDMSVSEVVSALSYAKPKNASKSAKEAVAAVFDEGVGYTAEPIIYFYAPARAESEWHETQDFVMEYLEHRFFSRKG